MISVLFLGMMNFLVIRNYYYNDRFLDDFQLFDSYFAVPELFVPKIFLKFLPISLYMLVDLTRRMAFNH